MRDGDGGAAANALYAAEREIADAGAVLAWPDRVKKGDLSGIQTAMNLYLTNPVGFKSEYQCEPESTRLGMGSREFSPTAVAGRVTGLERGIVPATSTRLTAFVDVGGELLWFLVAAWNEQFGGTIIDYGTYPQQNRTVFAKSDPRPSLSMLYPGHSASQRVFAGLGVLLPDLMARHWSREHGGESLKIERCLIDAGWGEAADAVYKSIARHGDYPIYPSKGVGRSSSSVGVAKWKLRPGERSGFHWRLTAGEGKRGRQVQFDPDAWKSFVHGAFQVPQGSKTGITLFGSKAGQHELFAEHLAAEYSEPAMTKGDTYDKWTVRPDRTDNDWLDCLAGAAVAASVAGVTINSTGNTEKPEPPKVLTQEEVNRQIKNRQTIRPGKPS
jgi:phage terminase large subunit GpA-like protein